MNVITTPNGPAGLKMRPVLDYRMPTLANKTAFLLHVDESAAIKKRSKLDLLRSSPPTCLKEIRHVLTTELKAVTKRVARLERAYYGVGKSLSHEIGKCAGPIKSVIRSLSYYELSSTKAVEAAIRVGADPKRYKGDPDNLVVLKDAYTKVQKFIPGRFSDIADQCKKMLEVFEKYCISFYDPERDIDLETAAHYEEQIRSWGASVRENLDKINTLHKRFKSRGIHFTMFSSPVAAFCQRYECDTVPFLLLFAEACTNIRACLSIMTSWIKADDNYAMFLYNDIKDLEGQREEQMRITRDAREKYHSATFKVNQAEIDYNKMAGELETLLLKEEAQLIEEKYLNRLNNELQMDLEFKESRREELKRKATDVGDGDLESFNISWDNLNDEIRVIRERLPSVKRQLLGVQHRLTWLREKRAMFDRLQDEIDELKADTKETEKEKSLREQELTTIQQTLELARRLYLYKSSTDSVEKIYYQLPVGSRHQKLPSISHANGTDGSLDKAIGVVIQYIDQDWMNLYRHLPFFPKRGSETIEKDIASINAEGARGPKKDIAIVALNRWRRHHTRARAEDLKHALREIRRYDILGEVEVVLEPPPDKEEEEEYIPPELDPSLIPFYRDVLRYDQLKASGKLRSLEPEPVDISGMDDED